MLNPKERITVIEFIKLLDKHCDSDDLTKFTWESSLQELCDSIGLIRKRSVIGEIQKEYLEARKHE